ncbi:transmembrane protein 26-like [Saccostrea cucullata]|uniref:transmembrane protein 26-like n=1 Tax=Saccostrea cuccullata TaxID=36930 RepID=UPI002ED60A2D
MSSGSLEDLVSSPSENNRLNDGTINPVFENKDEVSGKEVPNEDSSDLGERFLDDFNFPNSEEEDKSEIRSDVDNVKTEEDFQKENDSGRSTTSSQEQTTENYTLKQSDKPNPTTTNESLNEKNEECRLRGDYTSETKQPAAQPKNASKLVTKSKSNTDNNPENLDYVWGPLFQELPSKTVSFSPHYAIGNNSRTQDFLRQRKPHFQLKPEKLRTKVSHANKSKSKEDEDKWHHIIRDIIQAIFVRMLLICHSFLCVWRAVDVRKDELYWCLALTNVILILETIYTVIKRQGRDPKWICPCFVIYLGGTVPALWFLQIDKLDRYNAAMTTNISNLTDSLQEALSSIDGIQIPIYLDPDTWVAILEQILLFVLVVGRMLLPLGPLSREELSQLLFIYIGSGSDVMELFVVFDEPQFRTNSPLKYATLTVWSVSLLQFTFVLTAAKSPKKIRLGTSEDRYHDVKGKRSVFGIEILSLFLSFLLMDGPYCALRLYAIIEYKVVSYGIIFFTCKNILMLVLLMYRMFIICIKYRNRGKEQREALREIAHRKHVSNII